MMPFCNLFMERPS